MTETKCSFPTSPRLDRHIVYKNIQMWWKWKRNCRSNRKKSTSAEHDTLKNFETDILDLKTMACDKMTHFLFVNLLLAVVLWTTGKKPGRSYKWREYKLENSGNEKAWNERLPYSIRYSAHKKGIISLFQLENFRYSIIQTRTFPLFLLHENKFSSSRKT